MTQNVTSVTTNDVQKTPPSSAPYLSDGVYRPIHDGAIRYQPTPADGDDMTWREGYDNAPLTYAALMALVYRLQNEMHGLAAQVVELRERLEQWEGDS